MNPRFEENGNEKVICEDAAFVGMIVHLSGIILW